MQIKDKKVMIFGGFGLVGRAVCREILKNNPSQLIITSLYQEETEAACAEFPNTDIPLIPVWGNLFVREEFKDLPRPELMNNPKYRAVLLKDVLEVLDDDTLKNSYLYKVIEKYKPDIIIDCVNSATALAYQDIYTSYYNVKKQLDNWESNCDFEIVRAEMEKFMGTTYIPQLIRHIQILYEAARKFGVSSYIKVGTSGTGGMGLNIPYTHSEERPSRVLLSKSSLAGAHSLLLFLMARTPDAPMVKEIKPATAIAWKKIGYGEIMRRGSPIPLFDCPPESGAILNDTIEADDEAGWEALNRNLKSVYIDTGENGIFSYGEFFAITEVGQMQFVTPEEIAFNVVHEIKGGATGRDIIAALDGAIMGPTYRSGYMRSYALEMMKKLGEEHDCDSVAFENLGPPRLSKLLYEACLLKKIGKTLKHTLALSPAILSDECEKLVKTDADLRSTIISIGIPILMPDGRTLLRGPAMKIPVFKGEHNLKVDDVNLEDWAYNGWVDLREVNMQTWLYRMNKIMKSLEAIDPEDTSSLYHHGLPYWDMEAELHIGRLVSWIFIHEEQGLRMKD
ncbi:short-chain dehydrogenase [bacterium]|nr:short-chain dehydrogenase [FCB group bacterium]MBL7190182.1 short-chain dehydrogenase [bacterium]